MSNLVKPATRGIGANRAQCPRAYLLLSTGHMFKKMWMKLMFMLCTIKSAAPLFVPLYTKNIAWIVLTHTIGGTLLFMRHRRRMDNDAAWICH